MTTTKLPGIGGGPDSTKKSTVRILGGVVDAVGNKYGSGIGGGKGGVEVEIGGGAQVTAKGGKGGAYDGKTYGAGAAIGTNGDKDGKAGKEQDVNAIGEGTVTRVDPNLPADHTHEWTFVSSTLVADGQLAKKSMNVLLATPQGLYTSLHFLHLWRRSRTAGSF